MRTKIKVIISEDRDRYVPMRHGLCLINLAHRFPPYVRKVETSLDELQTVVIEDSPPEESIHPHEDCPCIDISDTVARCHHNPDNNVD